MNDFVASNGVRIFAENDHLKVTATDDRVRYLLQDSTAALREFFLAERDAKLGRWRSKEHPGYVVYPKHDGSVRVVQEATGEGAYHYRGAPNARLGAGVAAEYFAAHPERKPWHDAQPGEIWVLTFNGLTDAYQCDGKQFFGENVPTLNIDKAGITAGRCIWPESDR